MSKRGLGSVSVVLGLLLLPKAASAQEWMKDRRYQEGIGYRTGDLELHPGLAAEIGYDSNWFLRSSKNDPTLVNAAPLTPVVGTALLRVTPSLSLATLSRPRREGDLNYEPETLRFRAGLAGTYREYFTSDDALRKQRNMSVGANARLEILPERPWGAALGVTYDRAIQPTTTGSPDLSFNRDEIGAKAEVIAQPGSGTLDWRAGYGIRATLFEDTPGQPYQNINHEVFTRGRWKFRPRTAMLYDASMRFQNYSDASQANQTLHDSTPLRTRIGINGLVTPRFSFLAMAGYGGSFVRSRGANDPVEQYDNVIGQVEARFFLTANPAAETANVGLSLSTIAIGYNRDFASSYLSDFYGLDRGYMRMSYFFAGRALLSLEGGVAAIEYPTIYPNAAVFGPTAAANRTPGFTNLRADATAFTEYRFTDSFGLNATFRYSQEFSSTTLPQPTSVVGAANRYDLAWKRFEAFLGVRWFM